jgi:hypothetical protein
MRTQLIIITILWQATAGAFAQTNGFSKIFDFYPLNGELGLEIYILDDGYLIITDNDCVSFSTSSLCRTCVKFNINFEIEWMTELDLRSNWYGSVVEFEDAFYIGGRNDDMDSRMQLAKLNKTGDLLWQKKLNEVDLSGGISSMQLVNNDEIAISSLRSRPDLGAGRSQTYLMFIDLEGNLIDTIFFNEDFRWSIAYEVEMTTYDKYLVPFIYCPLGINCLDHRPGGLVSIDREKGVEWRTLWPDGWLPAINAVEQTDSNIITVIYQTRDYALPLNIQAPPAIFYLDTSGQILDSIVLWSNHLNQVRNTQGFWQDGIVACGQQSRDAEANIPGPRMGWIFRVDEDKEVLWQRSYSDTTYEGRNARFNHIKQTPDGGFILIGTIDNKMTGVTESHVWLMKVDSNGCLTPGCDSINIISSTEPVAFPSGLVLQLYPNPATTEVTLSLPPEAPDQDLLVSLLSSSGQVLRQQPYLHPAIRFDTSGLPPGMYYVTVHRKGSLVGVEKMIIAK